MPKRNLIWLGVFLLLLLAVWWLLPRGNESGTSTAAPSRFLQPVAEVVAAFDRQFVFRLSDAQRSRLLHELMHAGVAHAGDGFSEYIPPGQAEQYMDNLHGQFVGIGIEIDSQTLPPVVASVLDSSPAFLARPHGVLPGDLIVRVDGTAVAGRSVEQISQMIRGPAGSKVELVIDRPGFGRLPPMTITRDRLNRESVRGFRQSGVGWDYRLSAALLAQAQANDPEAVPEPGIDIGYIRISEFTQNEYSSTSRALGNAIDTLRAGRVGHLVIDLRSNPGGALSQAVEVVDRFVSDSVIVEERGAHCRKTHRASGPGSLTNWPIVVLVDRGTASAGEVVAGSLAFNGRAVLVGERTFGKGTMQEIINIPAEHEKKEGLLKLTVAYLYLPHPPYGHPFDRTTPPADFNVPLETWPTPAPNKGGIKPTVEVVLSVAEQQELFRLRRLLDGPGPTTRPDISDSSPPPGSDEWARRLLCADRQLMAAIEILSNHDRYRALLRKAPTTAAEPAEQRDGE